MFSLKWVYKCKYPNKNSAFADSILNLIWFVVYTIAWLFSDLRSLMRGRDGRDGKSFTHNLGGHGLVIGW